MNGHIPINGASARLAVARLHVARLQGVRLRYRKTLALDDINLELPAGCMVGFIGPDGVGKSSLFSLLAGARRIQEGTVEVLGGGMADPGHRRRVCPRIAYMPQGLGKNLYPTLSVFENVEFFARLFGQGGSERERRINDLLKSTGLAPFPGRPAGKLSGGMKQKLGLCCSLIHDPDLLILDEPTTGVDPLSRRQFWELIDRIRANRPGMSVMVATAYMEEAARFDWLVAINAGRVLATGTPKELLERTQCGTLEEAFIALLPEAQREGHKPVTILPRKAGVKEEAAIEAHGLTMRFGDFTAVDHVSFRIKRGEIFGFLGSNGCGKTTTMKMLTGLLPPSEGQALLFGQAVDPHDIGTRRRVGFMTQSFSLYTELTVRQNLELHAHLFTLPEDRIGTRVQEMARRFGLTAVMDNLPDALPLGQRQRLQLAVAMIHGPEILILDEPTSGVDPVARDVFWQIMIDLARNDNVTIFVSTHFMNEAMRCDRISLMHAGRVLVSDEPAALIEKRGAENLEDAFISYLEGAAGNESESPAAQATEKANVPLPDKGSSRADELGGFFNLRRILSYSRRESLELMRDPVRMAVSLLGSVLLMFALGFGVTMDVENVNFAVLDYDQTVTSHDYELNMAGSHYFIERPPLKNYADLDRRMRSGKISVAIEIPPGFARNLRRGRNVNIGVWIDGSMPAEAETVRNYAQGVNNQWLATQGLQAASAASIEPLFLYNPGLKDLPAMVPGVIPLILLMIPAMLSALSVVREKEMGSIVNLYVTPVTRLEFLFGKQLPYIAMALANFILLVLMAVTLFQVPVKGSFLALSVGALLYVIVATAIGLVMSSFTSSQVAAVFGTAILTMLPATQFCGLNDPVSSLAGTGAAIGEVYPTTHFMVITRGAFTKGLGFSDLHSSFIPLILAIPLLVILGTVLLRKQEN